MPISHPLSLLGLLSASVAVRILVWEENLSVFFVFRTLRVVKAQQIKGC